MHLESRKMSRILLVNNDATIGLFEGIKEELASGVFQAESSGKILIILSPSGKHCKIFDKGEECSGFTEYISSRYQQFIEKMVEFRNCYAVYKYTAKRYMTISHNLRDLNYRTNACSFWSFAPVDCHLTDEIGWRLIAFNTDRSNYISLCPMGKRLRMKQTYITKGNYQNFNKYNISPHQCIDGSYMVDIITLSPLLSMQREIYWLLMQLYDHYCLRNSHAPLQLPFPVVDLLHIQQRYAEEKECYMNSLTKQQAILEQQAGNNLRGITSATGYNELDELRQIEVYCSILLTTPSVYDILSQTSQEDLSFLSTEEINRCLKQYRDEATSTYPVFGSLPYYILRERWNLEHDLLFLNPFHNLATTPFPPPLHYPQLIAALTEWEVIQRIILPFLPEDRWIYTGMTTLMTKEKTHSYARIQDTKDIRMELWSCETILRDIRNQNSQWKKKKSLLLHPAEREEEEGEQKDKEVVDIILGLQGDHYDLYRLYAPNHISISTIPNKQETSVTQAEPVSPLSNEEEEPYSSSTIKTNPTQIATSTTTKQSSSHLEGYSIQYDRIHSNLLSQSFLFNIPSESFSVPEISLYTTPTKPRRNPHESKKITASKRAIDCLAMYATTAMQLLHFQEYLSRIYLTYYYYQSMVTHDEQLQLHHQFPNPLLPRPLPGSRAPQHIQAMQQRRHVHYTSRNQIENQRNTSITPWIIEEYAEKGVKFTFFRVPSFPSAGQRSSELQQQEHGGGVGEILKLRATFELDHTLLHYDVTTQMFSLLLITGEEYSFSLSQYLSQQGIFHLLTCKAASGNPSAVFQPPAQRTTPSPTTTNTPPWVTSTTLVENLATIEKVERWCDYVRKVLKTIHFMNLTPVQRIQYTEQQNKLYQSLQRTIIQNQLYLKCEQIRQQHRESVIEEQARKTAEEEARIWKQKQKEEMNYPWAKNSQAWLEEERKSAQLHAWLPPPSRGQEQISVDETTGSVIVEQQSTVKETPKKSSEEIAAMIAKAMQSCNATAQKNVDYFEKSLPVK